MDIDIGKDLAKQDLTIAYGGGRSQKVNLDIYLLNDQLQAIYTQPREGVVTDVEVGAELRAVLVKAGFTELPEGSFAAHAATQRIMHAVTEQKKRFDQTLWGNTAAGLESLDSIPASMLPPSPTPTS